MLKHDALATLISGSFPWNRWEACVRARGITLDRPKGSIHPLYPSIRYPIDYGYVRGTMSGDGEAVDLFVGSVPIGLVGAILTRDHRRKDREVKLLFNCRPEEIYLAHGFLNFDTALLDGRLALRYPMTQIWERADELSVAPFR